MTKWYASPFSSGARGDGSNRRCGRCPVACRYCARRCIASAAAKRAHGRSHCERNGTDNDNGRRPICRPTSKRGSDVPPASVQAKLPRFLESRFLHNHFGGLFRRSRRNNARARGIAVARSGVAVAFGLGGGVSASSFSSSSFSFSFFGVVFGFGVGLFFALCFGVSSGSGVSFAFSFLRGFLFLLRRWCRFGGFLFSFFGVAAFGFAFFFGDADGVGDSTVRISSRAFRKASRLRFSSSLSSPRTIGPTIPAQSNARTIQNRRRAM